MKPGIHLLHKPVGPTSFSLVQTYLQTARSEQASHPGHRPPRICHGGTLDPFASGLLLMLIEPATRLFDYLHGIPKTYEATVVWGIETDNGDPHGRVTLTGDASGLSNERLNEVLQQFVGWHEQTPHATSAKRIDGQRAYIKAHRGEEVVMPASRVYLHQAQWLSHDLPGSSRLRIIVRGGYYVRALARDLGKTLCCGAHLSQLHRTAIGPWMDPGPNRIVELNGRDLLPWAATRILTDQEIGQLRQGLVIPTGELIAPDWALPDGFPDPEAPVRGFHLDKFCFLLTPKDAGLGILTPLHGGL
jgi:tRNA pseudouridine55 synthase